MRVLKRKRSDGAKNILVPAQYRAPVCTWEWELLWTYLSSFIASSSSLCRFGAVVGNLFPALKSPGFVFSSSTVPVLRRVECCGERRLGSRKPVPTTVAKERWVLLALLGRLSLLSDHYLTLMWFNLRLGCRSGSGSNQQQPSILDWNWKRCFEKFQKVQSVSVHIRRGTWK